MTANGEVYAWGSAENGKLGHGRSPKGLAPVEPKPRLVRSLEALRIGQVAAGHMHSAAVASDGRALTWGNGRFRQLGLGPATPDEVPTPTQVEGAHSVAGVAAGGLHTLFAQHAGAVLSCGADQNGVLGLGHGRRESVSRPARIPGLASAVQVAAGWKHSAAVTSSGELFTWGWGGSQGSAYSIEAGGAGGQLGLGSEFDYWSPAAVESVVLPSGARLAQRQRGGERLAWKVLSVACGLNHTVAVLEVAAADLT